MFLWPVCSPEAILGSGKRNPRDGQSTRVGLFSHELSSQGNSAPTGVNPGGVHEAGRGEEAMKQGGERRPLACGVSWDLPENITSFAVQYFEFAFE